LNVTTSWPIGYSTPAFDAFEVVIYKLRTATTATVRQGQNTTSTTHSSISHITLCPYQTRMQSQTLICNFDDNI